MRPRAGTRPLTLEPTLIVEILSLARAHDDMLKEARRDLFRAATKLRVERRWKWPIRLGCLALGAAGLGAMQNEAIRAGGADFFASATSGLATSGAVALVGLVVAGLALYGAIYFVRRYISGPSPEKTARKLMEQFAQRDGVAAYVFAGEETAEDEAASIGALTRQENKNFRKRRLTASNRTLQSSLQTLLNRTVEDTHPLLH